MNLQLFIAKMRKSAALTKQALVPIGKVLKAWSAAQKVPPNAPWISNINKSTQQLLQHRTNWNSSMWQNYLKSSTKALQEMLKQQYRQMRHGLFNDIRNNARLGARSMWRSGNLPVRQSAVRGILPYKPGPNWTWGHRPEAGANTWYGTSETAGMGGASGASKMPGWLKFFYGVTTPLALGYGFIRPDMALG